MRWSGNRPGYRDLGRSRSTNRRSIGHWQERHRTWIAEKYSGGETVPTGDLEGVPRVHAVSYRSGPTRRLECWTR